MADGAVGEAVTELESIGVRVRVVSLANPGTGLVFKALGLVISREVWRRPPPSRPPPTHTPQADTKAGGGAAAAAAGG